MISLAWIGVARKAVWIGLAASLGAAAGFACAQDALPKLAIDRERITVSGLSSGGFMAVQFAVAHSRTISGVGVIAGGPYFCSGGNLYTAATLCSCTLAPDDPNAGAQVCTSAAADTPAFVAAAVVATNINAANFLIDPTHHLARQRIWLFSNEHDTKVPVPVVGALERYYRSFGPQAAGIRHVRQVRTGGQTRPVGHSMPTLAHGNDCASSEKPFINRCQYDAAGELLRWMYPGITQRRTATSAALIDFDQSAFLPPGLPHGMNDRGYAYVPAACKVRGARCRLHVVFHGCRQGRNHPYAAGEGGTIGQTFVRKAGYNEWAQANRIVVLYPQIAAPDTDWRILNPRGCWDYWGTPYTGAAFATRSGTQIAAVKAMIDHLAQTP